MIPRLVKPKRMTFRKPDSEKRKEAKLRKRLMSRLEDLAKINPHRGACRDCNFSEGGPAHDRYGKDSDCVHGRIALQR